jgi:hypothetical protein
MPGKFESDSETWTEAQCLMVLSGSRFPKSSALQQGAWLQLGKLRGFL